MKITIKILLITLLYFYYGCSSNNKSKNYIKDISTYKTIKDSIIIHFEVNNKNSKYLGFETVEMSPAFGFSSFCITDSIMYISDSYHNNIKKFLIRNNNCIFLDKTNRIEDIMVGDLHYYKDTIFVLSRNNLILKLYDKNLSLINTFDLNKVTKSKFVVYNGNVFISHSTLNDSINLYSTLDLSFTKTVESSDNNYVLNYWDHDKLWFYSQDDNNKITNLYGSFILPTKTNVLYHLEGENIRYNNGNIYIVSDIHVIDQKKYKLTIYSF